MNSNRNAFKSTYGPGWDAFAVFAPKIVLSHQTASGFRVSMLKIGFSQTESRTDELPVLGPLQHTNSHEVSEFNNCFQVLAHLEWAKNKL